MQDFAGISDISSSLVRSFWSSLVFSELKFASWTNLKKPPKSQQSCFPQLVLQERGSFIEFWELSFCFQQSTIATWLVSFCERNGFSGKSFRKKRHQQLPRSQHPAGYYGSIMLRCRAILHRLHWGKEMSSNCPTYVQLEHFSTVIPGLYPPNCAVAPTSPSIGGFWVTHKAGFVVRSTWLNLLFGASSS